MNKLQRAAIVASVLVGLAGCTSTGTGSGSPRQAGAPGIAFQWTESGSTRGSLSATLPDGRVFTGDYFQITQESRIDRLDPLWVGWRPGWRGWRYWQPQPSLDLVRHYSGQVLANLVASDGERIRCRLTLYRPSFGLSGGGQGTCQLPDGSEIDADFPPAN